MHTSGFSTLQHAANQSSLIFVFFGGGGSPLSPVTRFSFLSARKSRRLDEVWDERIESQQPIPFTSLTVGPSAEEGARHVDMTRGETSSGRAC